MIWVSALQTPLGFAAASIEGRVVGASTAAIQQENHNTILLLFEYYLWADV
jgi:hypothetical protein